MVIQISLIKQFLFDVVFLKEWQARNSLELGRVLKNQGQVGVCFSCKRCLKVQVAEDLII